jgi:hypothetical protein
MKSSVCNKTKVEIETKISIIFHVTHQMLQVGPSIIHYSKVVG